MAVAIDWHTPYIALCACFGPDANTPIPPGNVPGAVYNTVAPRPDCWGVSGIWSALNTYGPLYDAEMALCGLYGNIPGTHGGLVAMIVVNANLALTFSSWTGPKPPALRTGWPWQ
jgi:hypothetical protein